MRADLRVKIYCRSFDLRLYRLSKGLYESWGFPCVRLTDQSADGYFHTMLQDTECDIAINVDEDCFICDKQAVLRLVEYVVAHGYANAGCPDGASWVPRGGNPLVTNPFFNVFDLRLIREKYSLEAVASFDYKAHRAEMEAAFPKQVFYGDRRYSYDETKYVEPYYPFFLWLAYNTRTLYLPNGGHPDGWTTVLHNHLGEEICRHTWLARFYSVPAFVVRHWQPTAGAQKERIDAVIREAYEKAGLSVPQFTMADRCAFAANQLVRWLIKIPQRVAGWPAKFKQKKQKRACR